MAKRLPIGAEKDATFVLTMPAFAKTLPQKSVISVGIKSLNGYY